MSYNLGSSLVSPINEKREDNSLNRLEWNEDWFRIAFDVARDYSEGVPVILPVIAAKTHKRMEEKLQSCDWEIFVGNSAKEHHGSILEDALAVFDGG